MSDVTKALDAAARQVPACPDCPSETYSAEQVAAAVVCAYLDDPHVAHYLSLALHHVSVTRPDPDEAVAHLLAAIRPERAS